MLGLMLGLMLGVGVGVGQVWAAEAVLMKERFEPETLDRRFRLLSISSRGAGFTCASLGTLWRRLVRFVPPSCPRFCA